MIAAVVGDVAIPPVALKSSFAPDKVFVMLPLTVISLPYTLIGAAIPRPAPMLTVPVAPSFPKFTDEGVEVTKEKSASKFGVVAQVES